MSREIPMNAKRSSIYGNWRVYGPDGTLMFRTSKHKVDWYITKGLATILEDGKLQLNFTPKGKGHADDNFYLSDRENCCVVCGTTSSLTRHHIIPHSYRKHFPERLKDHNHHDIVPLCVACHASYNVHEGKYMDLLANKYGSSDCHTPPTELVIMKKVRGAAVTLMKHADKLPKDRIAHLTKLITDFIHREPTTDDILILSELVLPEHSGRSKQQGVAEKVENFQEFAEEWRQFFLEAMQPKFMPTGWCPRRQFGRPK